jgi:nitroreductase
MDTLQAIRERRSVKHYDPEHVLEAHEIRTLLEHALLSPTSFNMQQWRFIVVDDPSIKAQICKAAWNQKQIEDAAISIVLCADLNAHVDAGRYWQNASPAVQEMIVPMIAPFYADNPRLQRDEALRSIGIASQSIMLAAKSMGLDSCPMIGFDPQKVAELIQLPNNHVIGMLITVGKALKSASPRGGQLPYEEVVHMNHF